MGTRGSKINDVMETAWAMDARNEARQISAA